MKNKMLAILVGAAMLVSASAAFAKTVTTVVCDPLPVGSVGYYGNCHLVTTVTGGAGGGGGGNCNTSTSGCVGGSTGVNSTAEVVNGLTTTSSQNQNGKTP